jgi:hypothetical protein
MVGFEQAMEFDSVEPIQRPLYELIEVMVSAHSSTHAFISGRLTSGILMSAFKQYDKTPKSSFTALNSQQLPTQFSQPH